MAVDQGWSDRPSYYSTIDRASQAEMRSPFLNQIAIAHPTIQHLIAPFKLNRVGGASAKQNHLTQKDLRLLASTPIASVAMTKEVGDLEHTHLPTSNVGCR